MLGIYVHFPFCERKCVYCAFSSFVKFDEEDRYINCLLKEIEEFAKKYGRKIDADTIYFGGGTPSTVKVQNIKRVINKIKSCFNISPNSEITIECNPHSTDLEKLKAYKEMGINRISFGVQSLNDDELRFLGRLHNEKEALEKVGLAREAKFDNISADLIVGIKGQTEESLLKSVKGLINANVDHISSYMLQVEEKTPLFEMVKRNADLLPSDDECVKMYEKVVSTLEKAGYNQYEVSNFAKKGKESRHNFKYWTGENYVGFGLGAHSYYNLTRSANSSNFEDYYKGKIQMSEKLDREKLIEEHIMLGLRCERGISEGYLKSLGYNIRENENFEFLKQNNILSDENGKIYLNKKYYPVNNYIIVKLLP